jgi:hypothetical protein
VEALFNVPANTNSPPARKSTLYKHPFVADMALPGINLSIYGEVDRFLYTLHHLHHMLPHPNTLAHLFLVL